MTHVPQKTAVTSLVVSRYVRMNDNFKSLPGETLLALKVAGEPPPPPTWATLLAAIAAWPSDYGAHPVVERRLSRASGRGVLHDCVLGSLHDPLGTTTDQERTEELEELLRPLTETGAARLRKARPPTPCFRYFAELNTADRTIPEGGSALSGLLEGLIDGLVRQQGPVALSLAVAPLTEIDDDSLGATAEENHKRRVAFRLRICTTAPIPAALRARAEAICIARPHASSRWHLAEQGEDLDAARFAVATVRLAGREEGPGVDSGIAAFTLSLPNLIHRRAVNCPRSRCGAILGRASIGGRSSAWRLDWPARQHHTFVAGASGCGKSTALLRLMLDDIENARTTVLIDPHGDLADDVAARVPEDRLIHIDPRRADSAPLDLLDNDAGRAAAHLCAAAAELWPASFAGPVWQRAITLTARALRDALGRRMTLREIERFIVDPSYRQGIIEQVSGTLGEEVSRAASEWDPAHGRDSSLANWAASKLTGLTGGPAGMLFGVPAERQLEDQLVDGNVIVIALPVGLLGSEQAKLAARMFLSRLITALAARESGEGPRDPTSIIIDEAHLVVGSALGGLFAQSRKFGSSVTIATQAPSQLGPELSTVLTNAQALLLGRLPATEANSFVDRLGASASSLPRLARHHLLVALEDHDPLASPLMLTPAPPPSPVRPRPVALPIRELQRLTDLLVARRGEMVRSRWC